MAYSLICLEAPRQIYPRHISPLIASFTKKHPDITVELFFEDQQSDVVEKWFDAGYLYYPRRSQVLPKLRAFIEHLRSEDKLK